MKHVVLLFVLVASSASAQSWTDLSRIEAARRSTTHATRTYTNKDLPRILDTPRLPPSTAFADALRAFEARRLELRDHERQAYVAASANPYSPFNGPATPIAPLSQPWSVTTVAMNGGVATYFNGELIGGSPLSLIPASFRSRR